MGTDLGAMEYFIREFIAPVAATVGAAYVMIRTSISKLETKVERLEEENALQRTEARELVKVLGDLSVVLGKLEERFSALDKDLLRLEGKIERT